jgi:hypothetical protein
MAKIIIITERKMNPATGRVEEVATFGECSRTGRRHAVESKAPQSLGASFDGDLGEWVLDADRPALHFNA